MSDVLATNVHLANSQQNFNSTQINFENAVSNLNNLIGLPVNTHLVIDEDLKYSSYENDENFCLEYALNHRPDGIAANFYLKSSEEAVKQAKSNSRPNISAVVSGSITGEGAFKADHIKERWSAGFQMDWNIFDNNVTSAGINHAKSLQKKAESQANQQIEIIRLEVHNAYTALRISEKNIQISSDAAKQAHDQFLIAKVRYEEGVDTNLNVMDAQEKLTQARTNYFSALYSYSTARAQLEKAMGVPIKIDASLYLQAVEDGKVANKALEFASVE
jgi:outer membrane protein TolC